MREQRQREDRIRDRFEKFTASAAWRELPLKIKLIVLHLWRAERDGPSDKQ